MLFTLAIALAAPDLHAEMTALELTIAETTRASCGADLEAATARLVSLDAVTLDAHHADLTDRLWAARLVLHEQLVRFHAEGPVDDACVVGMRRLDLATRYALDRTLL